MYIQYERIILPWLVQYTENYLQSLHGVNHTAKDSALSSTAVRLELALSEEDIQIYLDRRKPGQNEFTTKRNESRQGLYLVRRL